MTSSWVAVLRHLGIELFAVLTGLAGWLQFRGSTHTDTVVVAALALFLLTAAATVLYFRPWAYRNTDTATRFVQELAAFHDRDRIYPHRRAA